MPTLDATVGGAAANSFVSIARAWAIVDELPRQGSWPTMAAASVQVGAGDNGTVTVSVVEPGEAGNAYTIEVVQGVGVSVPLAAALVGTALTVTLGTTAASAPDP